ncbi:ankyrin repeat protein [Diaporthe eres]|nr:ankyrin repeat protein [Diaporthe eres]
MADKEAGLFKIFNESLVSIRHDDPFTQERRGGEIRGAVDLLREIKDILDELNIIKTVMSSQNSVLTDAFNFLNGTIQKDLDRFDDSGDNEKLRSVLELTHHYRTYSKLDFTIREVDKLISDGIQKHANLAEAISAREASESAILQGRTIMVFTVVTIIFLPITFLSSLFALDISIFPHNDDADLSYTPGWAFSWMCVSEEAGAKFGYIDGAQFVNGEPDGAMKSSKETGRQGGWSSVFRLRTAKVGAPAV